MGKSLKHILKLTSLMCKYLNILLSPLSANLKQEQTTVLAKAAFKKEVAAIAALINISNYEHS